MSVGLGDRPLAPLGRRLAPVSGYRRIGAYDILAIADPDGPAPAAGQFYMVATHRRWGGGRDDRPYLARPLSVMANPEDGVLEFLLEDVGPGTHRLCQLQRGDAVWLLGPFGRGFTPPAAGRRPILVGGGVGIAPLVLLWRTLGSGVLSLLGFRDGVHARAGGLIDRARLATDDGSVGHQGMVTDLLRVELARDAAAEVYACGPPAMLQTVHAVCAARDVPAQLALETQMACGFGACFGCVVPTRRGYVRLCLEGPVLNASDLDVEVPS
jgi:dihydroorotate dehydrogenase electron transfer subunit